MAFLTLYIALAGPRKFEQELHEDFTRPEWSVRAVPCPPEDAPLPSRHLARISQSSEASDLSGHAHTLSGGINGQLHRLQLSDIVNLMLSDTSGHLGLPPPQRRDVQVAAVRSADGDMEAVRAPQEIYKAQSQASSTKVASVDSLPRPAQRHARATSFDVHGARSPSGSGTPHSDTGDASATRLPSAFANEMADFGPPQQAAAAHDAPAREARPKWLVRSAKQQAQHPEGWSSPLQNSLVHRHAGAHHQRAASLGADAWTRFTSEMLPEEAALREGENGLCRRSEPLDAQQ
jgi:hypothetical protein